MALEIKVINKSNNELPSYATPDSSGVDVRAYIADSIDSNKLIKRKAVIIKNLAGENSIRIHPGGRCIIPTGLYVEIPRGLELQVRPRSGLAAKYGVTVLNSPGTIDADYRGEIGIILVNLGDEDFIVRSGDRVAQLVLAKVGKINWSKQEELEDTTRGVGGFGSTGTNESEKDEVPTNGATSITELRNVGDNTVNGWRTGGFAKSSKKWKY